jgi:replicative DNA helicase
VVALAQLSRAVEKREDKRPLLSDLRDSGGIEEAADVVLFPYRPAYYERKTVEEQQGDDSPSAQPSPSSVEPAEITAAKNRKGRTGMVLIGFEPPFARFVNLLPEGP